MFKQRTARVADTIQMERQVEASLQFEVKSIPVIIDAPVELVWEMLGCSAVRNWCPFSRVDDLQESKGSPSLRMFSPRFLAIQQRTRQQERTSLDTQDSTTPPLPHLKPGESTIRRFEYELPRSASDTKWLAKSHHRVLRVVEDGYERTQYELCEQFFASDKAWDRSCNPGVMEASGRELAKEFKRVCEAEMERR